MVDASQFPLERIAEQVRRNRKIGLGVMGWADLLYQLRIPYDSADAITLAERIMDFIETRGRAASIQLAAERGPFPAYETSVYPTKGIPPLRNATITTIAPTGTLSILAGCSSGVEPLFALSFARNVMDGERLMEVNPHFEEALREIDCYSQPLLEGVAELGSIQSLDQLPEDLRRVFVTAMDIAPEWHLRMQAAFQRHTDNAVSKTVNLPNSATRDDIFAIYWMAYEEGCKGVTVYRDGSRAGVLVDKKKKKGAKTEEAPVNPDGYRPPLKRPLELSADIVRFKNGEEDWISFVGIYNDRPYEIFTGKIEEDAMFIPQKIKKGVIIKVKDAEGNKRYDFQYKDKYGYTNTIGGISRLFDEEFWNYAKLISGVLRNGMPILDVVTLIESLHLNSESINTWKNGVARALKQIGRASCRERV